MSKRSKTLLLLRSSFAFGVKRSSIGEGAGGGSPGTQHGAGPYAPEASAESDLFPRRRCSRRPPTAPLLTPPPQTKEKPAGANLGRSSGGQCVSSADKSRDAA